VANILNNSKDFLSQIALNISDVEIGFLRLRMPSLNILPVASGRFSGNWDIVMRSALS
jgi:hypothetical protein